MLLATLDNHPVILAPMAGILNQPLRLAFRELGWDVSWIGSVDAEAVAAKGDGRIINMLGKEEIIDPSERPLVIQLIGNDAETLSHAAYCLENKADVFDFNLGCPLPIATSRGIGYALVEDPLKMLNILKSFIRSTKKPVTAKIRLLSVDRIEKTVDLAKRIEDIGISGLIIHARTPQQRFSGPVNWEAIYRIKKKLSVPVIASGGIKTVMDIFAIREHSHIDSVMVGTGAIRNPFLVREYRAYITDLVSHSNNGVENIFDFASLYVQFACGKRGNISSFIKRFSKYVQYVMLRLRLAHFIKRTQVA